MTIIAFPVPIAASMLFRFSDTVCSYDIDLLWSQMRRDATTGAILTGAHSGEDYSTQVVQSFFCQNSAKKKVCFWGTRFKGVPDTVNHRCVTKRRSSTPHMAWLNFGESECVHCTAVTLNEQKNCQTAAWATIACARAWLPKFHSFYFLANLEELLK